MKPYTRSIIELFDGKKRFLIPLYQRQYAWNVDSQIPLLWEDIERIANRIDEESVRIWIHLKDDKVQVRAFQNEEFIKQIPLNSLIKYFK